jgi:hypothetical protein
MHAVAAVHHAVSGPKMSDKRARKSSRARKILFFTVPSGNLVILAISS